MSKKILIIGPIGNRGGREIETVFIYKSLKSQGYDVSVMSTSYFSKKTILNDYLQKDKLTSVYDQIIKTSLIIKIISYLAWIKNGFENTPQKYCSNKFTKNFFQYHKKVEKIFEESIFKNDLILFLGQLTSNHNKQIIDLTYKLRKPIIFRTTGKINREMNISSYFSKVSLFIHHGKFNDASRLTYINSNVAYIDQACMNEATLLNSVTLKNKINKFIYVGEITAMKGVQFLAKSFHEIAGKNDVLDFIGDGDLLQGLKREYNKDKRMRFLGQVSHLEVATNLKKSNCLIISSISETGPYVGLEAMAAGRLILSTKVGSMPERLKNSGNDFWFKENDLESFRQQYERIKELEVSEVERVSRNLKEQYLLKYSNHQIALKYTDIMKQCISNTLISNN